MYVEIIDWDKCESRTKEYINGTYANYFAWIDRNFYPNNGMVGEVVRVARNNTYIVKILDGIYVPMQKEGIKEISKEEFLSEQSNNVCVGMSDVQLRHETVKDFMYGADWFHLIDMRSQFKDDILKNLGILTWDWERNIFIGQLEQSCFMYIADMSLEYKEQKGSEVGPNEYEEIALQVCDVYMELFPKDFGLNNVQSCKRKAEILIKNSNARTQIDNYYNQLRVQYGYH